MGSADVALFVEVSVGMGGQIGFFATRASVPVIGIVGEPICAENMCVWDVCIANVALFVIIRVSVWSQIGNFSTFADVPVVGLVRNPCRTEIVFVGRRGNIGIANVTL